MQRVLVAVSLVAVAVPLSACASGFKGAPATYVTDVSATLNGVVGSNRTEAGTYWFEYGTTTGYGSVTATRTIAFQANVGIPVSEPISGLIPRRTYHYKLCARDQQGGSCSGDQTFTTGFFRGSVSGIAYESNNDIYTMGVDGSNQTQLTNNPAADQRPGWSPSAGEIVFDSLRAGASDLFRMDAIGNNQTPLTSGGDHDFDPAWSPIGEKIAFHRNPATGLDIGVFVMNPDGTNATEISPSDSLRHGLPAWSPDGREIAFTSTGQPGSGPPLFVIQVVNADGSNAHSLRAFARDPTWSPDRRRIAFTSTSSTGDNEIAVMDADGSNFLPLTANTVDDSHPTWSPDGRQIAFATTRDGNSEIYVMNADGSNQTRLTNNLAFDDNPAWSPRP